MNKVLKTLSSVKIAVVCLFLLFILTFWGTIAQVEHGLYASQERYFFSFFFKVFGVVPFPGAQLVLWVLFFNLMAAAITHFRKTRGIQSIGLKISHIGVFFYFIAAFVTFHATTESNLNLLEAEGSNVSASYWEWELASWREQGNTRHVTAMDVTKSKIGDSFKLNNVNVSVSQFYLNTVPYKTSENKNTVRNASGISLLEPKEILKEREKNVAGGIFRIGNVDVLLYGLESVPTKVGDVYYLLRHKRYELPFTIRLKQFKVEFHPGTDVAKSYESLVEVIKPNVTRDLRIFMNNPLRDKEYTLYQASYAIDAQGRKYSTLAVVQNVGQILPYIACFVVFFGLAFHFMVRALYRKKK